MTKQSYFKPPTPLTFDTVTVHRSRFKELLEREQGANICCDLSDVQVCDSAGLAFLIDVRRLCHHQNTQLIIENASVDILALAKLYGLEKILENEEDLS